MKNKLADVSSVSLRRSFLQAQKTTTPMKINTMKETALQKESGHKDTYRIQIIESELYLYKKPKR